MSFTRAIWTEPDEKAFCTICVELLDEGRIQPRQALSEEVLENLVDKFFFKTSKRYTKKQLRAKWDSLKKLYDLFCLHAIVKNNKLFRRKTKKAAKVFKDVQHSPPANLDLLRRMFHTSHTSSDFGGELKEKNSSVDGYLSKIEELPKSAEQLKTEKEALPDEYLEVSSGAEVVQAPRKRRAHGSSAPAPHLSVDNVQAIATGFPKTRSEAVSKEAFLAPIDDEDEE